MKLVVLNLIDVDRTRKWSGLGVSVGPVLKVFSVKV